ncbi:MAG: regulatory protein RecX [Candidatus Omnitrophica bacterium]|nr:regulatory protein RecX [Candidatus Omnitrophota bacterium]
MEGLSRALNYSFLLLKYRPRSRQEIIERLKRKKYPASVIEKVITSLEENNYINDKEFVRLYIASCLSRGWGRRRIDYALKKLGIAEDARENASFDKQAFYERLKELVEKKISNKKRDKKTYQKIVRNLAAKGFSYEDITRALEEADFTRHNNEAI